MNTLLRKKQSGFSVIEMLIAMAVTLVLLASVSVLLRQMLSIRDREGSRTDALTSARAALDAISREVANAGFGMDYNGLIINDCNGKRIRFRSNIQNLDGNINVVGEDVIYYYDASTKSILRYDNYHTSQKTTTIINSVSDISFQYFQYTNNSSTPTVSTTPSENTGRVRITITVLLPDVDNQPKNQTVTFTTDVTLRNSGYMLFQY